MTDERQIDDTTVMEKDGSGNLIIKNIDEAAIDKLAAALDANGQDITDSGTTVYDASTDTVGDGTTSANHSSVSTAEELSVPLYTDNTNAVQANRSIWYNDGSGPDTSGYYVYDNGTVTGPLGSGGGTSEWEVDGSGNLVPIDGEPIGDGTTSANHSSVSTGQVNDSTGTVILGESVASGSATLSSGIATIDTGVGVGNTATFYVALGPDTDDADVAADIRAQSGGNYEVDIQETDTSVGNPTINYDVVRVR